MGDAVFSTVGVPTRTEKLDRYPPEPKYEEDETRKHCSEKAFYDSYGGYNLPGWHESALLLYVEGKLTDRTDKVESSRK